MSAPSSALVAYDVSVAAKRGRRRLLKQEALSRMVSESKTYGGVVSRIDAALSGLQWFVSP